MLTAAPPSPDLATASASAMHGEIAITRVDAGMFRIVASGYWTTDYVDRHFGQLDLLLKQARTAVPELRVLVDLRDAAVQPAETAERIRFWTSGIYQQTDRVAMIVGSSLVKSQMRRVATIATRELFLSEVAALTWLRAS